MPMNPLDPKQTATARQAFLWVPLLLVAWAICGPVFGTSWFLIGFLVFTLVHFVSFECEEVRNRVLGFAPGSDPVSFSFRSTSTFSSESEARL